MWDQPHYLYKLHDPQQAPFALALEQHIPGVLAWAVRGRKRYRLSKNEWPTDGEPTHIDIYAPVHAAFVTEHFLAGWGLNGLWSAETRGRKRRPIWTTWSVSARAGWTARWRVAS